MDFDSTTAVLYAAALWFLGTLILWGVPMALITLIKRLELGSPREPRSPGQTGQTPPSTPLTLVNP